MSLLFPSGGLVYHARALLYRDTLWAPFRAALAGWLERHLPPAEQLILVGPSAGHCLPVAHLARFPQHLVLDPDPLARALLKARLGSRVFQAEWRDQLLAPLLAGTPGLEVLLARFPKAAVLFCNVLGQLHFSISDDEHIRFQAEFRRRLWPALDGRAWASFHDRWSLDRSWDQGVPGPLAFESSPSDEELAEACFGAGPAVTALDHGTSTLFPEALPRSYFSWQLTPGALHVVEAVAAQ